jgi:FkbM family methyltransferase
MIRRFGWRGVLIEPQPDAFERLRKVYADVDGLVLINAAVAEQSGEMALWRIGGAETGDPWWRGQVSSFDREHVLKHARYHPPLVARISSLQVATITLDEAFARAPRKVDVLQVDAEGYDARIVNMLDLHVRRPTVIRFEHSHLAVKDHASTVARLTGSGYRIAINEVDTIAMLHERGVGTHGN